MPCSLIFIIALGISILTKKALPTGIFFSILMCFICMTVVLLCSYILGLTKGERLFVNNKTKELYAKVFSRN